MGKQVFMHAADAHDDPKCARIIHSHGMNGYGAIWFLVEIMRRDANLEIPTEDLDLYAARMHMAHEDLLVIVKTALSVGFFVETKGRLSAPALRRDIEEFEIKRDKWRTKKRQQRDTKGTLEGHKEDEEEEEEVEEEVEDPEEDKKTKKKTKYTKIAEIPPEELEKLKPKFPHLDIEKEFEWACDWAASKGKRHKDALAFFRNWLRNDKFRSSNNGQGRNKEFPQFGKSGLSEFLSD